jgi:hypothetical protein
MLEWDKPNERYFHHGVDRGVLYIPGKDPVAWSGLTSVEEQGGGGASILYRDGRVTLAEVDASDFSANVNALFFPNEFSECLGVPEVAEGLYVDNQKPKRFGMSYRTLVGSGTDGDMFGYQIHLVYNAVASLGTKTRKTLTDTPEPLEMSFGLVCTPVKLPEYRPSAHYILDTRGMGPGTIAEIEALLYGTPTEEGRLPTAIELFEMLNFGTTLKVHDNGDGTVEIKAGAQYITANPNGSATITNINAVTNVDGTYSISDGGDTVIVP